jgi:hypothetical protein
VSAVAAIAVTATAVAPPAAASWLHGRRVAETWAAVRQVADGLPAMAAAKQTAAVLRGDGRHPDITESTARDRGLPWDSSSHALWLQRAEQSPGPRVAAWPPDGWGRCLFVRTGPDGYLIISAGANGLLETPIDADGLSGDDIGLHLR